MLPEPSEFRWWTLKIKQQIGLKHSRQGLCYQWVSNALKRASEAKSAWVMTSGTSWNSSGLKQCLARSCFQAMGRTLGYNQRLVTSGKVQGTHSTCCENGQVQKDASRRSVLWSVGGWGGGAAERKGVLESTLRALSPPGLSVHLLYPGEWEMGPWESLLH